MSTIYVVFKNDTGRTFNPRGTADPVIEYVEGFVVIIDSDGKRYSYPSADIARIEQSPPSRW